MASSDDFLFRDSVKTQRNIAYMDGTFGDMTLSPGGVPLVAKGIIVGGICSGGVPAGYKAVSDAAESSSCETLGPQITSEEQSSTRVVLLM